MSQPQSSFLATWGVLIVIGLAAFVLVFDITIMNVAIAAIVADLNTTVQGIQAAIALYAMVMAAFTIAGGKFGDVFGRRRVFILGLVCYAVGTLTAALTPNIGILALGWSLMGGLGAALILPMLLTFLTRQYVGQQLALSLSVIGGVQASGVTIGLIWGGFMASQLSWRLAFGSETLIVVIILALTYLLPRSEPQPGATIDGLGILLVATGFMFILFGVILASHYGWVWAKRPFLLGDWEVAPLGLSIVPFLIALGLMSLVTLGLWQQQQVQLGKTPLVRLALLRHRPLLASMIAAGVLNLIMAAILFTIPVFLQGALGLSPWQSASILLPLSLSVGVLVLSASGLGQLIQPRYVMLFGLVIMMIGMATLHQALASTLTGDELLTGLLVLGCGAGLVLAQITPVTLANTQLDTADEAFGLTNTAKLLGTALGTAIVGALLITSLLGGIATGVAQKETLDAQTQQTTIVALQDAAQALSPDQTVAFLTRFSTDEQARLTQMVKHSWIRAEQVALMAVMGFTLLCLVAVLWV
ncbi:MFS transporter [Trichothermofontia sp.]